MNYDYLCELNDLQRSAVETVSGPLMIVAGAGTGKTKTLTYRMYHLMKSGISGRNILGITFTNKAAAEMRERMVHMVGDTSPVYQLPMLKTFHALGIYILRMFYAEAGIPKNFNVADTGDTNSLIKEAMQGLGIDPKMHDPRKIKSIISLAKNRGSSATEFESLSSSATDDIAASIWHRYETLKQRDKVLDFDDLLIKTRDVLQKNTDVRNYFQSLWQYIHVDEYQDTNQIQYEIIKLLVGETKNLCVVGDSDQNIYSWRGANLKNMLNFERDFPNAQVIILEQNYRSTKNILDAAGSVIEKNTARIVKNLSTVQDGGELITVYDCMDGISEASMVAGSIAVLIDNTRQTSPQPSPGEEREPVSPADIAILYRTNFQSRIFEEVLLRAGIPYTLLGTKFFERKEIKDLVSYLKLAFNAESLGDLRRVINEPKRGLGPVALAKITAGTAAELSAAQFMGYTKFLQIIDDIGQYAGIHAPSESVRYAMERSGLYDQYRSGTGEDIERLENLEELVTIATKYDEYPPSEGFAALLEECALHGDQDDMGSSDDKKQKPPGVHLMTIHAAKGLEFDHVYIVGMEQGLFPHSGHDKKQSTEDREEERRLFYVAITRARKKLTLSYAHARNIFGQVNWQSPSEFLSDIPSAITETITDWKQDQDSDTDGDADDEVGTVYLDW
jgi:DNA helicase-2/ATP-dependent DNA helicase PcrA